MTDTKSRRSLAIKQAISTRRLYAIERKLIEKIWDLRRPRNIKTLQKALDLLWSYYAPKLRSRATKPKLRFGSGVWYHGRYLSYNMFVDPGQIIELAPGERNFYVLIHEIVHALGPSQHGIRFAEIYSDLLRHDTFQDMISTPEGELFLHYLEHEHPYHVRRAYRA